MLSAASLSNGNLDIANLTANFEGCTGTIYVSSGKYYFEFTNSYSNVMIGVCTNNNPLGNNFSASTTSWTYCSNGQKFGNGANGVSYGASFTTGDIIGVALDMDAGSITFYKNGVSQGVAFSTGLSGKELTPLVSSFVAAGAKGSANFGQRAFAYTAPSGFKALCTANLPAPLVTKPNTVMDVKLYTGNSSTQSITGLGFNPDFIWIKCRSTAYQHALFDSVRGVTKHLTSNNTDAEYTESAGNGLTSFNSDGFSLSGELAVGTGNINTSSQTYAAWTWDAGTSTVTNTQGSITASLRANPTAGFSVCTFTQPSSSSSFSWGHGLGVAPELVFMKPTSASGNWQVYHKSTGAQYLWLNSTNAATGSGWSTVSSSVVTATATLWAGNYATVAYCFAPVVGYSSFGSYVGNGSDGNGPFVYTGFRPKWVMVKSSSSDPSGGGYWNILDATRSNYNTATNRLAANFSGAEDSGFSWMDLLSNGFKLRQLLDGSNVSGVTYIYIAFAESPLNYARAR